MENAMAACEGTVSPEMVLQNDAGGELVTKSENLLQKRRAPRPGAR
jgi:hypothetical protein